MGVFDTIKFWRKEEEFPAEEHLPGLDEKPIIPEDSESDLPPHLNQSWGTTPGPGRSLQQVSSRDLELLNSKLDAIKAVLSSIEQRVMNIERATQAQSPTTPPQRRMPW